MAFCACKKLGKAPWITRGAFSGYVNEIEERRESCECLCGCDGVIVGDGLVFTAILFSLDCETLPQLTMTGNRFEVTLHSPAPQEPPRPIHILRPPSSVPIHPQDRL